jgi:hypothetical protein
MTKTVRVTQESDSGRNQRFHEDRTGPNMSHSEFVQRTRQGEYPDYHVRIINGIPTPASNPDGAERNNLG